MISIETKQSSIETIKHSQVEMDELVKNYPHAFRQGVDSNQKRFLVSRWVNGQPNLIITETNCIGILAKNSFKKSVPFHINEDTLPEPVFNSLPNFFLNLGKIESQNIFHFFHDRYKKRYHLISFGTLDCSESPKLEKFIHDTAFLAERQHSSEPILIPESPRLLLKD